VTVCVAMCFQYHSQCCCLDISRGVQCGIGDFREAASHGPSALADIRVDVCSKCSNVETDGGINRISFA